MSNTIDESASTANQQRLSVHDLVEAIGAISYVVDDGTEGVEMVTANSHAIAGFSVALAEAGVSTLTEFWKRDAVSEAIDAFRECLRVDDAVAYKACLAPGFGLAVPLTEPTTGAQSVIAIEAPLLEPSRQVLAQLSRQRASDAQLIGLVHDARNLVAPLLGWAELISIGETATQDAARSIVDAAVLVADLLEKLMAALTHEPESDRVTLPGPTISGLENLIRALVGDEIVVTTELDPDTPPVALSTTRLKQVVINLVINAREAMPSGGRITISTVPTQRSTDFQGSDWVHISVSDTGRGMDEATLTRALDPFFSRAGIARDRGIGLWAVANVVRQAGGDIDLESTPAVGSTVKIFLPVNRS